MSRELDRIRVQTSREQILTVAARWRKQYGPEPVKPRWAEVLRQLDALDRTTATAAEVEAIIGNRSWTREICDVCEEAVETWVRLGDELDYDSRTAYVCEECLVSALAILRDRKA